MKKYNIYYTTEENGYEVSLEQRNLELEDAKSIVKSWAEDDMEEVDEDGMGYETYGDGMVTEYHTITRIIPTDDKEAIAEFENLCNELREEMC